jgi:hypothetical protein
MGVLTQCLGPELGVRQDGILPTTSVNNCSATRTCRGRLPISLSVLSVSISGASRGTSLVRSDGWTSCELATTCENVRRAMLGVGRSSQGYIGCSEVFLELVS